MFDEGEMLALSGIQHFSFCRRQWALIHIEQAWKDNLLTAQGDLFHARAHDAAARERRGGILVLRGLAVHSRELGLSGICDVVEFHPDENGCSLFGEEGLWRPFPVEYKRGESKRIDADRLQLCAQAMCLEEMLGTDVAHGALFYGKTRRREEVPFSVGLRGEVRRLAAQMHDLYERKRTPEVRRTQSCSACSLNEICLPRLQRIPSVETYLASRFQEEE